MKRIWITSEYYYPIITSTGYYMTEITEYLAKSGIDVHVIYTDARYDETDEYKPLKLEKHNGVIIHRVLSGNIDKNSFAKRTFRLLNSSIRLWFKILKNVKRGDKLLVVTNPAFLLLFVPWVKRIKKIRYYLLVHGIFPGNLVAIGKMDSSSRLYHSLEFFFDRAYSQADVCISIGRDMARVIRSRVHKDMKIALISSWADNREVFPLDRKETCMYAELACRDKFVFQFAGNLGHAQGLDNILNAISLVKNPNLHFVFIDGGTKYEAIKKFTSVRNSVTLSGFQPRSMQNDFLNACDVSIVTLSDGMYGLGVPSKSYNIMAAGKPILMVREADSEIALYIKEFSLGWIVEPNNPSALKDMFESVYESRGQLSSFRSNARYVADTVFAKEIMLGKYYQLFD